MQIALRAHAASRSAFTRCAFGLLLAALHACVAAQPTNPTFPGSGGFPLDPGAVGVHLLAQRHRALGAGAPVILPTRL